MKSKFVSCIATVLAAFGLTASARAAGEIGQAAAPLKIAEWVKGKPADFAAGKGKQVFVVEFWATWCGPCRTSIPHLTELQKKFKDKGVIFIGVSNEEVDTVKKFVEKMGDKMDYTVAVEKGQETSEDYMSAFGVNGIPHAFIVDKEGRIVWHGHPMAELEATLQAVLDGKLDLAKEKKKDSVRAKMAEFMQAAQAGDDAKVKELGAELEKLDQEIGGVEAGKLFKTEDALKTIKFRKAIQQYQMAMAAGQTNGVEKIEATLKETAPKEFDLADFKDTMSLQKAATDYFSAAAGYGDKTKLPEYAKKLGEVKTKNFVFLNQIAWALVADERLKERDFELATKLAKASVDLSGGTNAGPLDTYARALFETGQFKAAVESQMKAIGLAENADQKKEMEASLKKYQERAEKK
ncbi:MAG: redoxin domain-containing protein [Verrucomicrobia bacterium]|nr:MAG: redoxin domain-containing protein [Verrucomicrobiota bacterium]